MEANFLGFSWAVWGGLCWAIALTFTFIWPKHKIASQKTSPIQHFILRWFHALFWVLLGISCFVRMFSVPENFSNFIAISAFGVYVVFLVVMSNRKG